jgi:hypothetical protein
MQGAFVMLMALSGLGCQNKVNDPVELPPPVSPIVSPAANPVPTSTTPPPYPQYFDLRAAEAEMIEPTHWDTLRSTLWSFILGRDPDVMTAREIEASVYGYGSRYGSSH